MLTPLAQEPALELLAVGLAAATRGQRILKRTVDLTLGSLLLVLSLPVLALVAIAVGLTSRGPVLYRQVRIGQHGRPFVVVKFRSMRVGAHERRGGYAHLNEVSGPVFKIRRDLRVTPVGRVIRKLSLDELPQLVNVLRGDMSLVGPRPPLPQEYATYTARQRSRLCVKPGLTCIWQVCGRSTIPFDEWVEMDLDYIRSWNLWLDATLLLRTIPAVLRGHGAW